MLLRLMLVAILSFGSLASAYEDEDSALALCRQDCLASTDPGWDLKSCLYNCELLFNPTTELNYCNSYEEDCDRDTDSE